MFAACIPYSKSNVNALSAGVNAGKPPQRGDGAKPPAHRIAAFRRQYVLLERDSGTSRAGWICGCFCGLNAAPLWRRGPLRAVVPLDALIARRRETKPTAGTVHTEQQKPPMVVKTISIIQIGGWVGALVT
jgi:hypothetical protein